MSTPLKARGVGALLPPSIRRWFWRSFYSLLVRLSAAKGLELTCMNWGYEEAGTIWPAELGPERHARQLYLALIRDAPLEGATIAEISCGRGGGLATVHEFGRPAKTTGVDLTPANIAECLRRFGAVPGLSFQVGDAMALPFADASLDALLSVEASHCYPDEEQFLREAARVLRPGGLLLWTDFRMTAAMPALHGAWAAHFRPRLSRTINAEVLAAMAADGPRRQALIQAAAPRILHGVLTYFAAASADTESVQGFARGDRTYFLLQLERPRD